MPTCYTDDLLFIHIPKCGGSSISGVYDGEKKEWLQNGYLNQTIRGVSRDKLPIGHVPLRGIFDLLGRRAADFQLIVVIVRNPFAQQVSQYRYWRKRFQYCSEHPGYEINRSDLFAASVDFTDFCLDRYLSVGGAFLSNLAYWFLDGDAFRYWMVEYPTAELPENLRVIRLEDIETELPQVTAPYRYRDVEIPKINAQEQTDWQHWCGADVIRMRGIMRKFPWTLASFYPELDSTIEKLLDCNNQIAESV